MNSDSNSNTLEEEARALIAKQEEFKEKILAERSIHLARIAELDELLAKLGGGVKRRLEERLEHQESMKRLPKRPNLGAGRYGSNGKGTT